MAVIAKEYITHNGESFEPGSVVKGLSSSDEKRLIRLKSAEYVDALKFKEDTEDTSDPDSITPEEFEALKKQLDNAATKEPLINAAEESGVNLTDEHKKKKETVIEEIILQGFEEEVLALLNSDD